MPQPSSSSNPTNRNTNPRIVDISAEHNSPETLILYHADNLVLLKMFVKRVHNVRFYSRGTKGGPIKRSFVRETDKIGGGGEATQGTQRRVARLELPWITSLCLHASLCGAGLVDPSVCRSQRSTLQILRERLICSYRKDRAPHNHRRFLTRPNLIGISSFADKRQCSPASFNPVKRLRCRVALVIELSLGKSC